MTPEEIDAAANALIATQDAARSNRGQPETQSSTPVEPEVDTFSKDYAAKLAAVQKIQETTTAEAKAKERWWDPAAAAYAGIPESVKPALGAAAGVAGFGALRSRVIPEKYQYGTPERLDEQAAQRLTKVAPDVVDPHAELRAQHDAAQRALKQAELTQKYYQTLAAEDMPEQRPNRFGNPARVAALRGYAMPSTPTPGLPLTGNLPTLETVPLGGSGTAEYAKKFGATLPEAQSAASMSAVQKAIPGQAESLLRGQQLMPNMARLAGSDLLVGPETQRQLQQEMVAKQQADAKALEAKAQALARSRAYALADVERGQEAEAMRRQALTTAQAKPVKAPALTPQQRALAAWERVGRIGETAIPGKVSGAGVATNLGAGLAPYLAEKSKESWDTDRLRALAYALGAAGGAGMATGNPYGIGLGGLAMVPAAVYGGRELYDKYNPPVKP